LPDRGPEGLINPIGGLLSRKTGCNLDQTYYVIETIGLSIHIAQEVTIGSG